MNKKQGRISPTRSIMDSEEMYTIVSLEEKGKVEKDFIWIEIPILDEIWDNSEWVLNTLKTLHKFKKESRKVMTEILANSIEGLSKDDLSFLVLNRKSLVQSYKYIKKYWL